MTMRLILGLSALVFGATQAVGQDSNSKALADQQQATRHDSLDLSVVGNAPKMESLPARWSDRKQTFKLLAIESCPWTYRPLRFEEFLLERNGEHCGQAGQLIGSATLFYSRAAIVPLVLPFDHRCKTPPAVRPSVPNVCGKISIE